MFDALIESFQTTLGKAVASLLIIAVVATVGYGVYRWIRGPQATPGADPVPEVTTDLPPLTPETITVRPDSADGWIIEEIDAEFDATLTFALPDTNGNAFSYVQVGITEEAPQLFPEWPGASRLPLEARVIGGGGRVRLVEQQQPVFAIDMQTEFGLGLGLGSPRPVGVAVGATALRAFGLRWGAFGWASAGRSDGAAFEIDARAGPYVSMRVFGPLGIGVGKDVLSGPTDPTSGWMIGLTVDLYQ